VAAGVLVLKALKGEQAGKVRKLITVDTIKRLHAQMGLVHLQLMLKK
jgi:hypothetical protein